jgi:penicillin amidase
VAFELLLGRLVPAVCLPASPRDQSGQWSQIEAYLLHDLDALPAAARRRALRRAAAEAAKGLRRFSAWGEMHRLRLAHFLAHLPVLGEAFVLGDLPLGGSRQTPMKTEHGLVGGRHHSAVGQMARHVSDLSGPDANWFVLLGGQDGWLGSPCFADQVALWRERRFIRMPLTRAQVAEDFPLALELRPG